MKRSVPDWVVMLVVVFITMLALAGIMALVAILS